MKLFENTPLAGEFLKTEVYKKNKKFFLWSFLAMLTSSAIGVIIPYLSKLEFDQLEKKYTTLWGIELHSPLGIFIIILGSIFLMDIISKTIDFLFSLRIKTEKFRMEYSLETYFFERLYSIDPGYTLLSRFSRMIGEVRNILKSTPGSIENLASGIIMSLIQLGMIFGVLSFFDWRIFVIIVLSAIILYGIQRFGEFHERKFQLSNLYETQWEMNMILNTMEDKYHHIAANGATDMLFKRYEILRDISLENTKKTEKIQFFMNIATTSVQGVSGLIVKIFIAYLIFQGTGSIGLMTMATMYMVRIENSLQNFFRVYMDRYQLREGLSIINFFLEFVRVKGKHKTKKFSEKPTVLAFEGVSFSYPKAAKMEIDFLDIKIQTLNHILKKERDDNWIRDSLHVYEEAKKEALQDSPEILHAIHLRFEAGKLYGIVGKNGAGKSTLTSLLLGFFTDYSGRIMINDHAITDIWQEDMRTLCGYISQEPYIMYGRFSIRDNLTLGVRRVVSDEELYRYLEIFGLKKKIMKLREGLDSPLKWDMDLSGGQKQIIALIRVILQDRPILILDEGTNQLDAENEMLVMNELLKNHKEKIIIFVTHRMNTMKKCDYIYTINEGYIEDSGTPEELSKRENAFRRFLDISEQGF